MKPKQDSTDKEAGRDCHARLVRFSSLSEVLEHAAPSLLIDLSGIGLIRAELVQTKGMKLRGLRRRPDGLWEEHPWGNCSESPQAQ